LKKKNLLHCGDASNLKYLREVWSKMKKQGLPLKVVVDDGSHQYSDMAQSFFFWFPRLEPGGLFIVEDIQPIDIANKFRTQFLPQIMADIHFCGGGPSRSMVDSNNDACFPQLQKFLGAVHCEMHICVFVRNNKPAAEPSEKDELVPNGAFDLTTCKSMMK